jgi:hypothetical protein
MPAKDLSQFQISGVLKECSSRPMGNSGKMITDIVLEVVDSYTGRDGADVEIPRMIPLQIQAFTMKAGDAAGLPIGGKMIVAGRVSGYSKESNGRTFHNSSLDVQSITVLAGAEAYVAAGSEEPPPF